MASKIVPGNVDGTYPKAGQDNSSQGFRDNFSAIKTNFTEAQTEIEDLQRNKANLNSSSEAILESYLFTYQEQDYLLTYNCQLYLLTYQSQHYLLTYMLALPPYLLHQFY